MKTVFQFVERIAPYLLRISLGLVLLWIGAWSHYLLLLQAWINRLALKR